MKKYQFIFILSFFCKFSFAQVFPVDTILFNGDTEKRINIVILGDGYTQPQMRTFKTDVQNFYEEWFRQTPFVEYKNYFNVFTINVPSNVSGAATNPNNLIDNYFGSSFNSSGIERLLVPQKSSEIVSVLANNFPAYDQVVMLVNSTTYGGSGGWVATASVHPSSAEIAIHEIGHSFSNLGDEYWAGSQYASEKANRTQESNPGLIKWKNWLEFKNVGIYEYESPGEGWYRPHQSCKMRTLFKPFCPVCTEQIFETIQQLSSPVNGFWPSDTNRIYTLFPEIFSIDLTLPEPNTLNIIWKINGRTVSTNTDSIQILNDRLKSGLNSLTVSIQDTSALSRTNDVTILKTKNISWELENIQTSTRKRIEKDKPFNVYPNPTNGKINIDYFLPENSRVRIELTDLSGKLIDIIEQGNKIAGNYTFTINLPLKNNKIILLKFITNDEVKTEKIVFVE